MKRLPAGKGYYEWCILDCEHGDPDAIAAEARRMGLGHVLWHIVDGWCNEQYVDHGAALGPFVVAMKRAGVECWGWGAVYPGNWDESVVIIDEAVDRLGLAGFVIDGEGSLKGQPAAARAFMGALRSLQPALSIGLSSYRYPQMHPTFPFREFLDGGCDFVMPQVYYEQSHNPAAQLAESIREYREITSLPYIPTWPIYHTDVWAPTLADNLQAMRVTADLGLPAMNYWDWYQGHRDFPQIWEQIAQFPFGCPPEPPIPPTPPTPPEEDMLNVTYKALINGQNIRCGAGTAFASLGKLSIGQQLTGLEDIAVRAQNDVWGKFKSVGGWVAFVNAGTVYLQRV